ncbi:MAG: hypothetical protein ACLFSL_00580 [Candidatus Woesearchaeota archaeon]
MAINFMKKIYEGKPDELTHAKFTRFGIGRFEREEMTIKIMGNKIKVQTGPEYVDVLLRILAHIAKEDLNITGRVVSTKDVEERIKNNGLEITKKRGKKYDVEGSRSPEEFKKLLDDMSDCFLLFKANSGKNKIKTGQSLPKPGKLIEKFATGEFSKDSLDMIKEEFLFDTESFVKEAKFKHTYVIENIIVDESLIETDPKRARLEAKRKGKVIRECTIDGESYVKEYALEV